MNTIPKFVRRWLSGTLLGLAALVWASAYGHTAEMTTLPAPAAGEEPAETNLTLAAEALHSYLKVQEQLHATQLALERNQQETEALAAKTTAALEAKLRALEVALDRQKSAEWTAMQETVATNNRLLLLVGGSIAGVGFFILLATGYLQWRAVNRLAEVSAQLQSSRSTLTLSAGGAPGVKPELPAPASERLFGVLSRLEQRILQLEHATSPLLSEPPATSAEPASPPEHNGGNDVTAPADSSGTLLAQGQKLLAEDKPREALACFETILQVEPNHGEALVKKGLALEAMQQPEAALACYDQAIAANTDLTIAYLQKGGLFNRLERYEEALQCYESALQAQEKAHAV